MVVHEICHAVTGPGHGKRFRARLRTAAAHSEGLGRDPFAQLLRDEAHAYEPSEGERVTASTVYMSVTEMVMETQGKVSFDRVVEELCHWNCLTPDELHRRVRRLRAVYEQECSSWSFARSRE